jgi:alkylation response protein AidB-like acyl-CoA dehydrogenase
LGRASLAAATILDSSIGVGCELVKQLASAAQKREVFDRLVRGELCFAIADESSTTRAHAAGEHFVITGSAVLAAGTPSAHYLIVATRTDEGLTLFMLDPNCDGIDYRALETIGLRAVGGLHEVSFRATRVPRSAVLGGVGQGADALAAAVDRARIHQAAYCVGCAQQVIQEAVGYACEREQFGQPIGKFQAISHMLVDRQVDVDAARALLYRAAWTADRAVACASEAAMANLACCEALLAVTSDTMRVYGGYGLTMEFDIQRHFRDARHLVVEGAGSASARDCIAQSMGLAHP